MPVRLARPARFGKVGSNLLTAEETFTCGQKSSAFPPSSGGSATRNRAIIPSQSSHASPPFVRQASKNSTCFSIAAAGNALAQHPDDRPVYTADMPLAVDIIRAERDAR